MKLLQADKLILGLLAHPIKHSYSPFIHNMSAEILNIDMVYLPFDVLSSGLKDAMKGIRALGINGFNVSIPHKEQIIKYLDGLSEEASFIGAVNTVVNDHGTLTGFNTDYFGIVDSLNPYKDIFSGEEVAMFGAGGASRAVILALIRNYRPKRIHLINRTEQRAETLREHFRNLLGYDGISVHEYFPPNLKKILLNSSLIINTTPVGMHPLEEDSIIETADFISSSSVVFDMVYNPLETKLLKFASEAGAKTVGGLNMLVSQAAKSFELWTGAEMPKEIITKVLTEKVLENGKEKVTG